MGYIGKIILGLVLLVCFGGIIAFVPYILGVFYKGFFLPIEIIGQTIYPVGTLPYLVWIGGISFIVGKFIYTHILNHI